MPHWLTQNIKKMLDILHRENDHEARHMEADALLVHTIKRMSEHLDFIEGRESDWWRAQATRLLETYADIKPKWYA